MISKKLYALEEALSVEKNKASHFYMYLIGKVRIFSASQCDICIFCLFYRLLGSKKNLYTSLI